MPPVSPARRALVAQSLALAAGAAVAAPAAQAAERADGVYRVVFQVSDAEPGKWTMTLNNIRNAQSELGEGKVTIELVAYGPGIAMLLAASDSAARVAGVARSGVRVLACENSMRVQNLTREQMHPLAGSVPSGVTHLIRRQSEGWAYIRS